MIDRVEVVRSCFLRQYKDIEFSLDRIVSTTGLHRWHAAPTAFTFARQRASCIGKQILAGHGQQLSHPV
eukprot:365929-Chlamydomonas_euryale.AAC.2